MRSCSTAVHLRKRKTSSRMNCSRCSKTWWPVVYSLMSLSNTCTTVMLKLVTTSSLHAIPTCRMAVLVSLTKKPKTICPSLARKTRTTLKLWLQRLTRLLIAHKSCWYPVAWKHKKPSMLGVKTCPSTYRCSGIKMSWTLLTQALAWAKVTQRAAGSRGQPLAH